MKRLLPVIVFAVAALVSSAANPLAGSRPNIILVLTDDQGYGDLACHGHPFVQTPHLDRFHAASTRLADFHTSPTCSPARAGLLSGQHPFRVGVTHTIFDRERLALGVPTVADVLGKAGYQTGIFGKWHLGDDLPYQPQSRGFQEVFIHGGGGIGQGWDAPDNKYFDPVIRHNGTFVKTQGFCTDVFFAESLRWIKNRDTQKPFFAFLSLNAPHAPLHAPKEDLARYPDRNDAGFFAMVSNIDTNIGKLTQHLADWELENNTLVIFMTDNGSTKARVFNAGMKGGKNSATEGGSRVPCLMRWPGTLKPETDVDTLTRHYDWLPTFAALAGADVADLHLDGRNLLPLLESPDAVWPDRTTIFHKGRWGEPTARQEKHRRNPGPENGKHLNFALRTEQWRLVGTRKTKQSLYNIQTDPGETTDLAAKHPEVVKNLMATYETWWNEVRPNMVNDGIKLSGELYYRTAYKKQEQGEGIGTWSPPAFWK